MATTVKIICKYYQIREYKNDDITPNTYSLIHWLNNINSLSFEERFKNINNIEGRLEEIAKIGTSNIYALNFMRTDSVSTSYKVKKNTPAEHIDIEVGEYIAKNTVCIYDADTNLIMMQSNRGGYTETLIENYINSFWDEKKCVLLPVNEKVDIMKQNTVYNKIDVRFANINDYQPVSGSFFEEVIRGMNKTEGITAHIEIGIGKSKNSRLNKNEIKKTMDDIHHNIGCISSAKVKYSDEQFSGIYDLFDNLCKDEIYFSIGDEDKGCIKFDKLAYKMYSKYAIEATKNRVLNAITNI